MKARHRHVRIEMTVYVIVQLKMTDRAAYDRYQARFFDLFKKFKGRLLSADESPSVVEGDWNRDKLVLMSFPARKPSCCWRRDLRHRLNDRQALPPPPRPEAKSEADRRPVSVIRGRVIRIRPIIGWPRQIIRPVVSAVPVTIVVPIAAPRAQVCRLRGVTCVHAGLRRSR